MNTMFMFIFPIYRNIVIFKNHNQCCSSTININVIILRTLKRLPYKLIYPPKLKIYRYDVYCNIYLQACKYLNTFYVLAYLEYFLNRYIKKI